jgi:glucose-1-phosphate cytidylyltransferase
MEVVILAGGYGTRLAEHTKTMPKPLVSVGDRPIIWHIMQRYASFGHKDFVLALGYKGDTIKKYFLDQYQLSADLNVNLKNGKVESYQPSSPDWDIKLVDTGQHTMTGGRLLRLREHLKPNKPFLLTYGDGLSDINFDELIDFHEKHGKLATVSAVRPPARFGELTIQDGAVTSFAEKSQLGRGWINGGFFVFEYDVLDYIDADETMLEREPLTRLSEEGELFAYQHSGFWQCMDNIRDHSQLNVLWDRGDAPWGR